jgi:hypothetical protein
MVAVLIPVLARPQRVARLVANLAATSHGVRCNPVFLCTPSDEAEIAAVRATAAACIVTDWDGGPGDYARKINLGFARTHERFVLLAADDLYFHGGWAERAVAAWYESGACVIGTNDLANPAVLAGEHATHSLVHRDYGECGTADEQGKLLHEGYGHNFVDNEFVETARARGTFWPALDSRVEHEHPIWSKGHPDATYEKGQQRYHEDQRLFLSRRRLWAS